LISIISAYYNSVHMLQRQLDMWNSYPKGIREQIEFIVVDDGSPLPAKIDDCNLNLSLYRIEENIPWNFGGSKNLGAVVCSTDWFLIQDIDYVLDAENMEKMLKVPRFDPLVFYCFKAKSSRKFVRYPKSSILVNKETFWAVDGYDEDFSWCYGKNNAMVPWRLQEKGVMLYSLGSPFFWQWLPEESPDVGCTGEADGWSRYPERNNRLYKEKQQGKIPWSRDCIRFDWSVVGSWTT